MAGIVSLAGRETMIHEFLDANAVTVRLNSASGVTLNADTTVIGDMTELDDADYSAQTIAAEASWDVSNTEGVTTFTPAANDGVVTFELDGSEFSAYHYYVTYNDGTNDVLLWAEELDPALVDSVVQTIQITIRLRVQNPS